MPARAVEMAFERGMNYFYFGSMRREAFAQGVRNLRGNRERIVLVIQSYTRVAALLGWSVERALARLRFDYTDVLLLGAWSKPVWPRVLDSARELQLRGRARFLALSSHNRPLLGSLAAGSPFDVIHLRYNAVHRGAEQDIFPRVPSENRPGIVSYTATCWRQLLKPKNLAPGDVAPTAGDCYRFVLSNPHVDLCMTGTSDEEQTRHALEAMEKGPMTAEELAWMRRTGDGISGKRRP